MCRIVSDYEILETFCWLFSASCSMFTTLRRSHDPHGCWLLFQIFELKSRKTSAVNRTIQTWRRPSEVCENYPLATLKNSRSWVWLMFWNVWEHAHLCVSLLLKQSKFWRKHPKLWTGWNWCMFAICLAFGYLRKVNLLLLKCKINKI